MAKTFNPFGLRPVKSTGAGYVTGGLNRYRITNGQTGNIVAGDPVLFEAGTITRASLSVTAADTNEIIGVFDSAYYIDATRGLKFGYFPTGTSSAPAPDNDEYVTPWALVYDDPRTQYLVQADATVSAAMLGSYYQLTSASAQSLYGGTGRSGVALDVATSSATAGLVQIVDIWRDGDNALNDPFPWVVVKINLHKNA